MMYEPIRGGTRGGAAEFKWSDVSADKDRENYLGHSINAPTGRWQKNKDVHWYNRDKKMSEEEKAEEIRLVKEAEAEALSLALGFKATVRNDPNAVKKDEENAESGGAEDIQSVLAKEAKKRRKEEKRIIKEEKRVEKQKRKVAREERRRGRDVDRRDNRGGYGYRSRSRSRSRSPLPPSSNRRRYPSRSRSRSHSRTRSRDRSRGRRDFDRRR